jgi:hypothetical protein
MLLLNFETESFAGKTAPLLFFVLYTAIMSIVLVNLLIAILSHTHRNVFRQKGVESLILRAKICSKVNDKLRAYYLELHSARQPFVTLLWPL